jgi:hypothetical protein
VNVNKSIVWLKEPNVAAQPLTLVSSNHAIHQKIHIADHVTKSLKQRTAVAVLFCLVRRLMFDQVARILETVLNWSKPRKKTALVVQFINALSQHANTWTSQLFKLLEMTHASLSVVLRILLLLLQLVQL